MSTLPLEICHRWSVSWMSLLCVSVDVPVLPFPSVALVGWRMSPSWDRTIEYQVGRDFTDHLVQPCLVKARSRKDAVAAYPAGSELSNVEKPPNSLGRLFQWLIGHFGLFEVWFPVELCAQRQEPVWSSNMACKVPCCKFRDIMCK